MLVSPSDLMNTQREHSTLCASPWEIEEISSVESWEIFSGMAEMVFYIVYIGGKSNESLPTFQGFASSKRLWGTCCIIFPDICKVPPVKIHISPQTHQVAGVLSERNIRSHLCACLSAVGWWRGAVMMLCWFSSWRRRLMMWLCWVLKASV